MDRMPPIQKIYEAYSAVADQRVDMEEGQALVTSSNGKKTYTVTWKDNVYTSNDNATYWQKYSGYPIIAVLMLQGQLSLDQEVAAWLSGIDWRTQNAKHKANYEQAVAEVLSNLRKQGADISRIKDEVQKVYKELQDLNVNIKRGAYKPLLINKPTGYTGGHRRFNR